MGAAASLGKDVSDDKVQVERGVKEVALSVLANEARMARSDEKIRKVKVTELFMKLKPVARVCWLLQRSRFAYMSQAKP